MKAKIIPLLLLLVSHPLFAQIYSTCDQWGNTTTNGYTIYNNIWGGGAGSQCLTVNSFSNWYVDANHPNTSGIKSYPNVERKVNLFVDSMGAVSSSFAVTRPSTGAYSSTYDIWYNNYAIEVMLWMNKTGAVGPIASGWDANGNPIADATNQNVGGHTWNVYRGSNGSNEVFSFVRTSNTNSGTVDITAISQWLRNRGWMGNANLHSIQFGFEITSSGGSTQRYSVTNFSVTTGGGGGTTLNVSPTSLSFGSGSGNQSVSITSNTSWSVSDNQSWISVSPTSGSNNGSTSVSVTQNTSTSSRSGTVTVSGGGITRTVSITQAGTSGGGGGFPAAGTYSLRSRTSGRMLDNMGRTTNGSNVGQWQDSSSNNQRWVLSYVSSNVVKLRCVTGGLYLDGMGRTSNGSIVGQWADGSSNNQRWTIINLGGGYFKLKNVATGLCLDVGGSPWANGDNVEQWGDGSSQNQHWQFVAP